MAQYTEEYIDRLHVIWGPGFLSPGGEEEVVEIVQDLELTGKRVLDIGCGAGGPTIVLAKRGAEVTGIDVEPQLIDRTRRNADTAGVGERVTVQLIEPGPLPFDDDSFDVVFSKEALIHLPDKPAIYAEILRVLKPGGDFAGSDWLCGENPSENAALQDYIRLSGLDFTMATAGQTADAMRKSGFVDVRTVDRNAWYVDISRHEVETIAGPAREELIRLAGQDAYDRWLAARSNLADAVASGGLRPTHLHGRRPA